MIRGNKNVKCNFLCLNWEEKKIQVLKFNDFFLVKPPLLGILFLYKLWGENIMFEVQSREKRERKKAFIDLIVMVSVLSRENQTFNDYKVGTLFSVFNEMIFPAAC